MIVHESNAADYQQKPHDRWDNIKHVWKEWGIDYVLMSDEAHFHLNGIFNNQNCHF